MSDSGWASLVGQPLDGPTLHAGVVEREPRLTQFWELQQGVLEPAEGAAPGDGPLQQVVSGEWSSSASASGSHVLCPGTGPCRKNRSGRCSRLVDLQRGGGGQPIEVGVVVEDGNPFPDAHRRDEAVEGPPDGVPG
jgi:hypothetical protein